MDSSMLVIAALVVVVLVVAVLIMRRGSGGGVVVVPPRPSHGGGAAPGADELGDLLARGNKIAAIKLVRERTDWGLKEAKDYVDALAAGRPVAPLPTAATSVAASLAAPSPEIDQAARALLARGSKIEAIKLVRERTGWGLKEAKDYVERL